MSAKATLLLLLAAVALAAAAPSLDSSAPAESDDDWPVVDAPLRLEFNEVFFSFFLFEASRSRRAIGG